MSSPLPTIPSYEILDELGQGGMGTVYLARDTRLDRRVALKLLPPYLSTNAGARQRFIQEARAAAALEHPSICTVYEVGETGDGQVYITMPYYQGRTLQQRLALGPMPAGEALGNAAQIARALAAAHAKGIVHRDIKPANIMLPAGGGLVILDFGIAKLPGTDLTRTGSVIGTLAYMSPEQAQGEPVDHRSDIWSLGVVLYEMLSGRRPFEAPSEHAVVYAILASDPAPITTWRPELPGTLDSVVRTMLAKSAAERPASIADLADRLAGMAAHMPTGSAQTEPRSAVVLDGERKPVAILAARLEGYDGLIERCDPAEAEPILTRIRHAMLDVADRHRGHIDRFERGGLLCLFGLPASEEDDAHRAVLAATELVSAIDSLGAGLEPRLGVSLRAAVGVHVGMVIVRPARARERRWEIAGAPIAVAERLADEAEPGTVRQSAECRRLLAPFARSIVAPYAGRTAELGTLGSLLEAARRGEGQVVWIVGEAGVGKTRLLSELRARITTAGGVRVLSGRCQPQSRGSPYHPFLEVLRDTLDLPRHEHGEGRAGDVAARLRALDPTLEVYLPLYLHLLSESTPEFPLPRHLQGEHLLAAVNDALTALVTAGAGDGRATVLVVEDLQWADAASRTVLGQLADIAPAHPLLVAATGRTDDAMDWGAARPLVIHLGALDRAAAQTVMQAVLGASRIDPALAEWLHERTAGNPFFLEEACQSLVEEGAVLVTDGVATLRATDRAPSLPETVQAVIRARMDRLDPDAREILRVASVVGRDFTRGLLEHMLGRPGGIGTQLDQLKRAGLVQQTRVAPEPAYRFKHALIQEVAYDTLLEHQRRALHGATGRAIEQLDHDRLDEQFERLAHHFSRAEAWEDAVRYGVQAAKRASDLQQAPEAFEMLEEARACLGRLSPDDARRDTMVDILLLEERLCETLGRREQQQALIDAVIAVLPPGDASPRLAEVQLRQGDLWTLLGRYAAAAEALEASLRISREQGDAVGERNALRSLGMLRWQEGRNTEALEFVEDAVTLDRARQDVDALVGDLHNLGTILKGMKEYERAMTCAQEALDLCVEARDPLKACYAAHALANIHRDLGDLEQAKHYHRLADQVAVEHRAPLSRTFPLLALAHIALEEGAADEAVELYREVVELSRKTHHAERLAQALRMLGETLVGQGRSAEALPLLEEAAELFQRLQDAGGRLEALEWLIRIGRERARTAETRAWCTEAAALADTLEDPRRGAAFRNILAILAWEEGDYAAAAAAYEEALRDVRQTDQRADEGLILNSLGMSFLRLGRHDEARLVLEQSLELNRSSGERLLEAHALAALGEAADAAGQRDEARRRFGEAAAIRRELGHSEAADRLAQRVG